jgi:hypothetical protein
VVGIFTDVRRRIYEATLEQYLIQGGDIFKAGCAVSLASCSTRRCRWGMEADVKMKMEVQKK